jgi:hypothetical protein
MATGQRAASSSRLQGDAAASASTRMQNTPPPKKQARGFMNLASHIVSTKSESKSKSK